MGSVHQQSNGHDVKTGQPPYLDVKSIIEENARLRTLVVQLSDIILRRVTADSSEAPRRNDAC